MLHSPTVNSVARHNSSPNVPVPDRIILHLWEQDFQADHFIVTSQVTRSGIAESCALHPPNVSRAMRQLNSQGLISQHSRTVRGDNRRQKTWQLTDEGRSEAKKRLETLSQLKVLIRDETDTLLELEATQAANRLQAESREPICDQIRRKTSHSPGTWRRRARS